MARQFRIRKASIVWTDKRAKLLLEILGMLVVCMCCTTFTETALASMRIVKYFTYEKPFLARAPGFVAYVMNQSSLPCLGIFEIRKQELKGVVRIQFAQSAKYAPTSFHRVHMLTFISLATLWPFLCPS